MDERAVTPFYAITGVQRRGEFAGKDVAVIIRLLGWSGCPCAVRKAGVGRARSSFGHDRPADPDLGDER